MLSMRSTSHHRNPWWACCGCWKEIALLCAAAAYASCVVIETVRKAL